jgi:uncharacterized RDD family membrane protein YckC
MLATESGSLEYAGVVTRTIAIVLDALLVTVAALAVAGAALLTFAVFSIKTKHHTFTVVIGAVAFLVWATSYFAFFWTTTGQTPGARLMHIRVIRFDGTRMRPRNALIRLGAMVISLPLFWGYVPILTSARRRGVPDALAGTVVSVVDDLVQPGQPRSH